MLSRFSVTDQSIPMVWIIATAVLFRCFGILGYPLFEDDFYRYLWDGYRTATNLDPYTLAPAHYFGLDEVPERFEEILSGINYPDIATVYGPVCQWIFAAAYWIAPASIWPLQAMMAISDLLILLILCSMTRSNLLLLYAWSPLLIKEFAMTAHPDIAAIALSMLAVWLFMRSRFLLVGIALGMAIGIKVFAILLLPFLLFRRYPLSEGLITTSALLITLGTITGIYGTATIWFPEGLKAMAESWFFNAPLYLLLTQWLSFTEAKLFSVALFLLISGIWVLTLWYQRLRQKLYLNNDQLPSLHNERIDKTDDLQNLDLPAGTLIPRGDYLFGLLLICIPVLNPWYLPWLLPFAVIYPSRWVWMASISVSLSYWSGLYTQNSTLGLHELPASVLVLEFGLVAMTLLWDWYRPIRHRSSLTT